MKIKQNIKLITIIPIALVFLTSIYFLFTTTQEYQKTVQTKDRVIKSKILKNLSVNLAREKGLSIIYQLSNNSVAKDLLSKQRQKCDAIIVEVKSQFSGSSITAKLQELDDKRRALDNLSTNFTSIYSYYDNLNTLIVTKIKSLLSHNFEKFTPLSNAYLSSIKLLELSAKERDFITKLLSHNGAVENSEINKILTILKNKDINEIVQALKPAEQEVITNILTANNFSKLSKDSTKMKKEIFAKINSGNYLIKPIEWFQNETKKIVTINTASNNINTILVDKISQYESKQLIELIISALVFLFSLYMFYLYIKLNPYLNSTIGLERLLDKIIDYALMEDTINLGTTEGIEKAYDIIEETVDKIAIEKKKAQRANASKSIFLANMSHEIRTPINGIIGFTELLKKSPLSKEDKEYVNIIDSSTNNLLEIINNILDLSKIENNKIDIEEILFSPIEEFENSVNVYLAKAADKDINLSLYMDLEIDYYLSGDPTKIKEVLHNLINNAIKFTPNKGHIDVTIKNVKSDNPKKEKIYFEVQDNGIGISDDKLEDIFNAFSQADSTITRKYGGTGLGLAISSNYVSLMGGNLEVNSQVDKGSTFYFTLEFTKEQPLKSEYKNRFKNLNAAVFFPSNADEKYKIYMDKYIQYFGIKTTTITELKKLDKPDLLVVKADMLNDSDFDILQNAKTPIMLILKTPYQERLNTFKSEFVYPVCEPLTQSKVFEILNQINSNLNKSQNSKKIVQPVIKSKKTTNKTKILVAEDNEINQKLLTKLLQNLGLQVTTVNNGLEAYNVAKENRFDLIFMDIAMPILNGITATNKIVEFEKNNSLKHTPIVAITANALKGDKEKFLNEGLDNYISKPIKERDLINILEKYDINYCQMRNLSTPKTNHNQPSKIKQVINHSKNKNEQNILIFKKSKVETKIFEKVINKLYDRVVTANSIEEFYDQLNNNNFKVIMVDKEISELDLNHFLEYADQLDDTILLLFRSFDSIIDDNAREQFHEVLINSADSEYLGSILENYISD